MREYIFQNRSRLLKYVIVPIAKHPKAFIRQCCIPHLIAARLQMLASVYLDNGFAIKADEIKDVPLKGGLPAKFEASQAAMAQQLPHGSFGFRRGTPQRLRKLTIAP